MRRGHEIVLLSGILLVALALRLHALGDELWFDEIVTQLRVSHLSALEIAASYESQNQHLLYSLLARAAIVGLGDTPAALRLPAAVFGVLSVAAVALLGRELLSRREALLAAALLAVSGLHVWFSQNARGYSALLFFTLLSSWLLLRALGGDRRRTWAAYAITATLGLYVHLTMLFVLGAHGVMTLRRRLPGPSAERATRLTGPLLGFALAAVLALLAYAPILPQLLTVTAVEGRDGAVPEWSSSSWAIGEVVQRLRDTFTEPLLAVLAVVLGLIGVASVARRCPVLLELLLLPLAIGLAVVVGSGHNVWPRLFFFAIGFAALVAVAGATALGERLAVAMRDPARATHAGTALAIALVAVAASAVPAAYGPKQRHAEALAIVDGALEPGDAVVVTGPSTLVVQQYHGRSWPRVSTAAELAAVRSGARRTWFVHSFPVQLRGRRPDLARVLDEEFELVARLPGTLRGGDVLVWVSRSAARSAPAPGG